MTQEIQFKKTYNETTGRFTHDPTGILDIDTHEIVATGPIAGVITLDDGMQYDVTENYIGIRKEHSSELHAKIKAYHNAEGRFMDAPDGVQIVDAGDEAPPTDE